MFYYWSFVFLFLIAFFAGVFNQEKQKQIVEEIKKDPVIFNSLIVKPLEQDEKDLMRITTNAFRVIALNAEGVETTLKGAVITSMTKEGDKILQCGYVLSSLGNIEQEYGNCVSSVTKESKGTYLIVEKFKKANTIATFRFAEDMQ